MKTIFEKSIPGRCGTGACSEASLANVAIDSSYLRSAPPALPELSELDVVRHFTELSHKNFSVDSNFYPLGSCTMKYNPKILEKVASLAGFTDLHPLLPQFPNGASLTQGALRILYETDLHLREITGMDGFTLQPMAGAHGELTGILIMAAYHRKQGNEKKTVLIPDSAHGTNPASAAIAGYDVITIPSDENGVMDRDELRKHLNDEVAGLMLTCPNTLGIFNPHIREICDMVHEVDGLVYYDGANLNAIIGKVRPGDIGFDIVHLNLHKTFATPHGGGGPGSGPIGVCEKLVDFLPVSIVIRRNDGTYALEYDRPGSIGYIAPFYGNFGVILKAYAYILLIGKEGLQAIHENAVLNANYLKEKLKPRYEIPYGGACKHEFVLSASRQAAKGVRALDLAKALIDRGIHPPTVYFPLIVSEAMMIEPTETEGKETLDQFVQVMVELAELAENDPEKIKEAPLTTPVGRLDEVTAARNPNVACVQ